MKDHQPQENHILEKNIRVISDCSVLSRWRRFVLGFRFIQTNARSKFGQGRLVAVSCLKRSTLGDLLLE